MSQKTKELEDLVEFLSIAIARERESIAYYTRAYHKCVRVCESETVQKTLSSILKQKKKHQAKLREQLHEIRWELMRAAGPRKIERSIVIEAPPEKVFALVDDQERTPEWNDLIKEVKVTSKECTGVGSTQHYVSIQMDEGPQGEWDTITTKWVENEGYSWRTTSGDITNYGSITLKPVDGGTEVTLVLNYELPYSILGRIIDKLLVSKEMEKGLTRALRNLKDLVEKK